MNLNRLMDLINTANHVIDLAEKEVSKREIANFAEIERRYREYILPALIEVEKIVHKFPNHRMRIHFGGKFDNLYELSVGDGGTCISSGFNMGSDYIPRGSETFYYEPKVRDIDFDKLPINKARIALVVHWDEIEPILAENLERFVRRSLEARAREVNGRDENMKKLEGFLNV